LPFPRPIPGLVIRYAYLWRSDYLRGQEEGVKDRPCAVVLMTETEDGDLLVTVLPVTHTPPGDPDLAVEIPHAVKRRLGLDDDRSWVVLSEANRFTWPGPDVRMATRGDPASIVYGELPGTLLLRIRDKFVAAITSGKAAAVLRSE
jgi:hypothetical protein